MTTNTVALYVVSRLVLSPNVTRPAVQQQHSVSWDGWGGVVGGPGHYVVTPTRVEVELGCDNIKLKLCSRMLFLGHTKKGTHRNQTHMDLNRVAAQLTIPTQC